MNDRDWKPTHQSIYDTGAKVREIARTSTHVGRDDTSPTVDVVVYEARDEDGVIQGPMVMPAAMFDKQVEPDGAEKDPIGPLPGPYRVDRSDDGFHVVIDAAVMGAIEIVEIAHVHGTSPADEANANLLASSWTLAADNDRMREAAGPAIVMLDAYADDVGYDPDVGIDNSEIHAVAHRLRLAIGARVACPECSGNKAKYAPCDFCHDAGWVNADPHTAKGT